MADLTRSLNQADWAQPGGAEELLNLVYDELRAVAQAKLNLERRDQTLQATALVHEAWIRLGGDPERQWPGRAYFFAAAGEAMRRILIDRARRKQAAERAGLKQREDLAETAIVVNARDEELFTVHEALSALESEDANAAKLVKLRYFVGMSLPQAAEAMELPQRTAERMWTFCKAFLKAQIRDDQ